MTEFKLLLITIALWGASTLANLPSNDDILDQDVRTISTRVNTLNVQVPDLELHTRIPATDVPTAEHILGDLHSLNNALLGVETVAPHSLTTLTCSRALCFGDDQ
jgi:hypothetical protein